MSEAFPKKWYEWALLALAGFIFLPQTISQVATLLNVPDMLESTLVPVYGICWVAVSAVPKVLAGLAGSAGMITCAFRRNAGIPLLITGIIFFAYWYIYLIVKLSADLPDVFIFSYLLILVSLLIMVLLKRNSRHYCIAAMLAALLLIFIHADADGISYFLAMHLN